MAELLLARAMASTRIAAPPEKVFDAWLDEDVARQFLAAGDHSVADIAIDSREGGAFNVSMANTESSFDHHGHYVVLDRPRRLVFTWISPATEGRLTMVEINFTPENGGTLVELRHDGLLNEERERQHAGGWQSILDKLQRAVG
jgi:uncharacterized protein YndB with AHSA1/START domain